MYDNDRELWILGLGAGLCVDASLLLAAVVRHWPLTPDTFPAWVSVGVSVATLGTCGLPLFIWVIRSVWAAVWTLVQTVDAWRSRNDGPPADEPPAEPAEPEPARPIDEAEERDWRLALDRFFRAGDTAGGFSIRKLDGVVGSDTWGRLTGFYCSEAGLHVLRVGPGETGTVWGHGWALDHVMQVLAAGKLPHPSGAVPVVDVVQADTTRRDTKRRAATAVKPAAQAVVDN